MNEDITYTGLGFFGKVTASISHELKNRMAVINEQAGLLEDLVLMAERGASTDFERLKRVSNAVKQQVARGDRVLQNMNRFAHSVDHSHCMVEIGSLLDMIAALAARQAGLKGVPLEVVPAAPAVLTTAPFMLMNLIWLCIESFLSVSKSGNAIELMCAKQKEMTTISIGNASVDGKAKDVDWKPAASVLASALGAELVWDYRKGLMTIRLPNTDMRRVSGRGRQDENCRKEE